MESGIFTCYAIINDNSNSKNKPENFTIGKKYLYQMDFSTHVNWPGIKHKIMNDKKEWVDTNVYLLLKSDIVTTRCKFIKDFYNRVKGDIVDIVLSIDKKTFIYRGEIYNAKEYLKIL